MANTKVLQLVGTLVLALALSPAVASAQVEIHPNVQRGAYPPPPQWATARRAPAPVVEELEPSDPAETRLSMFSTADTLGKGDWSLTWREFATVEVAVGLTDWLEVGIRSIPILLVVPGSPQNTLWTGGLRLRMLKTSWFTATTEVEGVSFLGWGGIRAGVTTKLGTDRFAFHAGLSGLWMWQHSDDAWLEGDVDYAVPAPKCSGSCTVEPAPEPETPSMAAIMPNVGVSLRLHRRVKLMAEAAYISAAQTVLVTPALRLHGKRFSTDIGVMTVYLPEEKVGYLIPLVNMSVRF